MGATTVKLDADLLREIAESKPSGETLSSFVRNALRRDLRRRKMKQAGDAYVALMARVPKEQEEQEQWEAAPLVHAPRIRKK